MHDQYLQLRNKMSEKIKYKKFSVEYITFCNGFKIAKFTYRLVQHLRYTINHAFYAAYCLLKARSKRSVLL